MVTLQDVAAACGVSVTTVSHVLNQTRYVSPELAAQVLDTVKELGYKPLRKRKHRVISSAGIGGSIGFLISRDLLMNCGCRSYVRMAGNSNWITVAVSDSITEKELIQIKKSYHLTQALVHSSVELLPDPKKEIDLSGVLLVNQEIPKGDRNSHRLILDYKAAMNMALRHLFQCGHMSITIICSHMNSFCRRQILEAVERCAEEYAIPLGKENIIWLSGAPDELAQLRCSGQGTAVVTVGLYPLQAIMIQAAQNKLSFPEELSLIAIDDDSFIDRNYPEITSVELDPKQALPSIEEMDVVPRELFSVPTLKIRDSVGCLPLDPYGRKASGTSSLSLTLTEKLLVRRKKACIGVSFANGSTLFSEMILQGIQEAAANMDIALLPVQDAKNNPEIEENQLFSLIQQGASAIISISNDHQNMVEAFTRIAHSMGIPVILGSHLPINLSEFCYRTCIATNDDEKGRMVAKFLADEMQRKNQQKAVLIFDKNSYAGAQNCAASVINTLTNTYPKIQVLEQIINMQSSGALMEFETIYKAYPDLQGIYAQDAGIAGNICEFLRKQGREDVTVVTSQINNRFARQIMLHNIDSLGIVSSRPMEMGHWMVNAAASIILGKNVPPYITIEPVVLNNENVEELWPMLTRSKLV